MRVALLTCCHSNSLLDITSPLKGLHQALLVQTGRHVGGLEGDKCLWFPNCVTVCEFSCALNVSKFLGCDTRQTRLGMTLSSQDNSVIESITILEARVVSRFWVEIRSYMKEWSMLCLMSFYFVSCKSHVKTSTSA